MVSSRFFLYIHTETTEIYTLSLHDALPISRVHVEQHDRPVPRHDGVAAVDLEPERRRRAPRSEEHTSELQSLTNLVCRLLLEKKKNDTDRYTTKIKHPNDSLKHAPNREKIS